VTDRSPQPRDMRRDTHLGHHPFQDRSAATAANPLDSGCPVRAAVECRPSVPITRDGPRRLAHSYGSEGPRMTAKKYPRYAFL
jgi:hypothetical protein